MKTTCKSVVKRIALENLLSPVEQAHISSCADCQRFLGVHIDLMRAMCQSEQPIPDNFSRGVMQRILETHRLESDSDASGKKPSWQYLAMLWDNPAIVYSGVGIGGVVAFFNITRFVFSVLIPG